MSQSKEKACQRCLDLWIVEFYDFERVEEVHAVSAARAMEKAAEIAWAEWAWEESRNFPLRVRVRRESDSANWRWGNVHLEQRPEFVGVPDKK